MSPAARAPRVICDRFGRQAVAGGGANPDHISYGNPLLKTRPPERALMSPQAPGSPSATSNGSLLSPPLSVDLGLLSGDERQILEVAGLQGQGGPLARRGDELPF